MSECPKSKHEFNVICERCGCSRCKCGTSKESYLEQEVSRLTSNIDSLSKVVVDYRCDIERLTKENEELFSNEYTERKLRESCQGQTAEMEMFLSNSQKENERMREALELCVRHSDGYTPNGSKRMTPEILSKTVVDNYEEQVNKDYAFVITHARKILDSVSGESTQGKEGK